MTMPDRKKVMSWLEGLAQQDWRMFHSDSEVQEIARNALELLKEQQDEIYALRVELASSNELAEGYAELLKEQEAINPEVEVLNEIDRLYRCPRCHKCFFYEKQKYCDQCGQAVKWE